MQTAPQGYRPPFFTIVWESLRILAHVLCGGEEEHPVAARGSALVILDPLTEYASLWSENASRSLRRLIREARAHKVPIIVTRWVRTQNYPCDQLHSKGHWSTRLPQRGQIMPNVLEWVGEDGIIIDTVFTDAWTNPTFVEVMEGRTEVVFAGMWTEACVLNTVRSTAYRNIKPVVCKMACGGHFPERLNALCVIQAVFGEAVKSVSWVGSGDHQAHRTIRDVLANRGTW